MVYKHDNGLRQLAAWVNHPAADENKPAFSDCMEWQAEQPKNADIRTVNIRAVNLVTYGKATWFVIAWRDKTPVTPKLVKKLGEGLPLTAETKKHLIAGHLVSVAVAYDDFWLSEVK